LASDLTGLGENMTKKRDSKFLYAAGGAVLAVWCVNSIANGAEPRRIIQFQMTSTTFEDGGLIPPKVGFTKTAEFPACFGQNVSPQLSWVNVRAEVKSFALTVHELEDPPNVSLVVYGIPANVRSLSEGELSEPSDKFVGGKNARSMGTWRGMCPMPGQKKHYEYTMRGTDLDPKALPPGLTTQELDTRLDGHTLGRAVLVGRFDRDKQVP
jgi:phosphatidylethanolamine-binding protein (PEBP) family uncharacterized protein